MADQRARHLRNNPTEAEKRLWYHIRRKQMDGFRFRRQVPVGKYIVDFACLDARLVIEIDGGQHNEASHQQRDADRTGWLESEGYQVLRFWNNEVFENLDGVLQTIQRHLLANDKTPPPRPSPLKGEGD